MAASNSDSSNPVFSVVTAVREDEQEAAERALLAQNFDLFHLEGDAIVDKAGLLSRLASLFPPVEGVTPHNWDALADWLWIVLDDVLAAGSGRVALVWTRADRLVENDLQAFIDGLRTFTDVARGLMQRPGSRREAQVILLLSGRGKAFAWRLD